MPYCPNCAAQVLAEDRFCSACGKAIAPNPGHAFLYPWPEGKVPLSTVGHFYDEPIDLTPKQATLHRKALSEGGEFKFKPLANASLRSVEALKQQTEALGDDAA